MLFSAVDSWLERVSAGQIRRPQPGEKECMQCRVLGTRCTRYGVKSEFGAKVKPCEASIKSHKFAHSETSSVTVIIIKHFRGPRILTDTPIYIYNMIYKHIYIYLDIVGISSPDAVDVSQAPASSALLGCTVPWRPSVPRRVRRIATSSAWWPRRF